MLNRYASNIALLLRLDDLIKNNKDLRFSQILDVYGFVKASRPTHPDNGVEWINEFYLESEKLLERVEKRIEDRGMHE